MFASEKKIWPLSCVRSNTDVKPVLGVPNGYQEEDPGDIPNRGFSGFVYIEVF
jgi:hypothetical protein